MIYLEDFERSYLLHIITGSDYSYEFPISLPERTVVEKIKTDISHLNKIEECNHKHGVYKGVKKCCVKCGHIPVNAGIKWELEE